MIMEKGKKTTKPATKGRGVKIRIKIIGVGDAGCRAVESLIGARGKGNGAANPDESKMLPRLHLTAGNLSVAAVNTDMAALEKCGAPEKLQIGIKVTHGLSAGGDPQVGRLASQQSVDDLRELVKAAEIVVVTAGLGGGTGTGVSPLVARLARDQGACTLAVVGMPFEFEGQKRRQHAMEGFEALRSETDAVIGVAKDKLFQPVDGHAGVLEAFRRTDEMVAHVIWSLAHLTHGSVVNVDFTVLKAALKKSRLQTVFGFAAGRGERKHAQAVEALLAGPMLDKGRQLESADEMILSVVGGPGTSDADVQEIMAQLNRRVTVRAHSIVAADIDERLGDGICVGVIASNGSWRQHIQTRFGVRAQTLSDVAPRATTSSKAGRLASVTAGRTDGTIRHGSSSTVATVAISAGDDQAAAAKADSEELQPARVKAGTTGTIGTPIPFDTIPRGVTTVMDQDTGTLTVIHPQGHNTREAAKSAGGKPAQKLEQATLPLEMESKGRFVKAERTLYNGEDLDVPAFQRRGVKL